VRPTRLLPQQQLSSLLLLLPLLSLLLLLLPQLAIHVPDLQRERAIPAIDPFLRQRGRAAAAAARVVHVVFWIQHEVAPCLCAA
jgi:hypothetical protein